MDVRHLRIVVLAAAVIGGLGVGAWLLAPGPAPAPAPGPAPSSSSAEREPAAAAPAAAPPPAATPSPAADPVAVAPPAPPVGKPPVERMPPSRPADWPPVDPDEEAAWVASEPVALHAERHAEDWADLAFALDEHGERDLAWEAMSLSSRLERARRPVPEDEVRALLMKEIDLLLLLDRSELPEELTGDLEPILQGAHHAIQGAPPPEPR